MLGLEALLPPREEKIHRGNKHNSRVAAIRPEGLRPGRVFLPGIRWPWDSTSIPTAPPSAGKDRLSRGAFQAKGLSTEVQGDWTPGGGGS